MGSLSKEVVHIHLVKELLRTGFVPSREKVASQLGVTDSEMKHAYQALADTHGLVLHPHVVEPWVIHPFSLAPSHTWVESKDKGWWAPCTWCALGIAALAGGEVRIETRLGAEREPLSIVVTDGVPASAEPLVVHFAIPPKSAWDNVHLHCALLLPFRSSSETVSWCERHAIPFGEAVPLEQAASMARAWYGGYASEGWHKWSKAEAQVIFRGAGLTSSFWDLRSDIGGF